MERLMASCNNYFERTAENGKYTISKLGSAISNVRGKYYEGQYVRIMDSLFNDGVYKIKSVGLEQLTLEGELINEEFNGYIVGLAVPRDFVELATKVNAYDTKAQKHAGVSSESIPNYSVTFDAANKDGIAYYSREVSRYKKPFIAKFYFLKQVHIYE